VNRFAACCLLSSVAALAAAAQPPKAPPAKAPPAKAPAPHAKKAAPKTDPAEAAALTRVLRDLAKKYIPDPLSKSSQNWGKQTAVTVVRRYRDGLRFYSEAVQELRNDGHWKRTTLRVPEPDKIALAVTELTHPTPGKVLATVAVVAERVDVKFEQQLWRNGRRLYGGETRAHCKGGLLVKAEVVSKTEFKDGSLLPEVTLKLRLTDADVFYENLVVDHTAGLDGDAAVAVGDLLIDLAKAVKPDVEKELRDKAEAAVVKAVGVREFRLELDRLLQSKPKK
jgi:hypothetical protein